MTNKILDIISTVLETPVDVAVSQSTCEKWDSLHHLQLIVALEEAFDVSFEPEEIAEMKSVAAIENIIKIHKE